MTRRRPTVLPISADGPALVAILDVLGDLFDLLDERLSPVEQPRQEGDGTVRLTEPAVPSPAEEAITEPERPKPVRAVTQEPDEPDPGLPAAPPRAGRGSGLEVWEAFADSVGVTYPAEATRNDIIAACVAAKVIEQD
jgi:hypothetical protein